MSIQEATEQVDNLINFYWWISFSLVVILTLKDDGVTYFKKFFALCMLPSAVGWFSIYYLASLLNQ